jgi:hypothetical protein
LKYTDHEKLAAEDLGKFDELLLKVYENTPIERCHELLRQEINELFRRRDTTSKYRFALEADRPDMIEAVGDRYVVFNGKSPKSLDEKIEDFRKSLKAIIRRVYLEKIRELARPQPLDSPDLPSRELPQSHDSTMQGKLKEIRLECYYDCLKKLPERIKNLFVRYYPSDNMSAQDLAARRLALASEGEKKNNSLGNLQAKVHKWRTGKLEQCVKDCANEKLARDIELNYLAQQ